MNCPYCGAETREGQRYCTACGGDLRAAAAEATEQRPKIDLSDFFDELPAERPEPKPTPAPETPVSPQPVKTTPAPRPAARTAAPSQPEKKPEKAREKSKDTGLNAALMIVLILAVAVVTFVLLLLFWPKEENPGAPRYDQGVQAGSVIEHQTPTEAPAPTETPEPTPEPTVDPATEYVLPESNVRYLTEEDLRSLSHEELCFARNEIFARHGYIFQQEQIDAYFAGKSWYRGTVTGADFRDSVLNEYELANISLIVAYEKDHFGGSYY